MQTAGYKRCAECGETKAHAAFSRNRSQRDGLNSYCKPCSYARVNAYRKADPEKYRKAQRRQSAKWAAEHPDRWQEIRRAHHAVAYAIKRGKLKRPEACSRCGATGVRIYGHHSDYSKVLEVVWLCPPCHYAADHQQP